MKFEEALELMRTGKKITHPVFDSDVYFQACRIRFVFYETPLYEMQLSIVKMRGDRQHEDMCSGNIDDMVYPGTMIVKERYLEPSCKHGHQPQLDLFLVMSDDWKLKDSE